MAKLSGEDIIRGERIAAASIAAKSAFDRNRAEAMRLASIKTEAETMEVRRLVYEALREGMRPSAIHETTGMSRSTIYRYRDEYALIAPKDLPVQITSPWSIIQRRKGSIFVGHEDGRTASVYPTEVVIMAPGQDRGRPVPIKDHPEFEWLIAEIDKAEEIEEVESW